jgi:voltage-gated potassium channel
MSELTPTPTPTPAPVLDERRDPNVEDPSGRLAVYLARTQTPLDLLALLTLWIVVVPPGDFGSDHHASTIALAVRIGVSVVYGIDIAIRSTLARRHWRYAISHPIALATVVIPPLRVIFSLRLVRSVFRRGSLGRFMVAAGILVLNGAAVAYLFERHASGSNIHTFGESVWWSVVTVTTVGYGDYFPVTLAGRITAVFIMGIGILTLAVITAQVASSFVDQAANRRGSEAPRQPETMDSALAALDQRLARIEDLLLARAAPFEDSPGAPEAPDEGA